MQAIQQVAGGQVIVLDGKQLRRSDDRSLGKEAIYMVSAWAGAAGLVLAQKSVDEHSNEMTAIPQLLDLLDVGGCIVTIDAIGAQTKIAETIVNKGADYLLPVKDNQQTLLDDMRGVFTLDQSYDFKDAPYDHAHSVNKNHARIEIQDCWCMSDPAYLLPVRDVGKWKALKSPVMLRAERIRGDKHEVKVRYYISSLETSAARFLKLSRAGIKAKRLLCAWDEDYLLKVLAV